MKNCPTCGQPLPHTYYNQLAEVSYRMADFILKQPIPISRQRIVKLFWKDCRPPHDMDECLNYLVDSEQICSYIYVEGKGPDQRINTVLGSAEVMAEFIAKLDQNKPTD